MEEEGGAGGVPLPHGQDAVVAHAQLQVLQVAVQPHVCAGVVVQHDGHIAVDDLHVHALERLGGEGRALHPAHPAVLAEEAAPVLIVAHGEGPALFPGLCLRSLGLPDGGVHLCLRGPSLPGKSVLVAVKVDGNLSLEAVGVLFPQLALHVPQDAPGLVHRVLGLADRLIEHVLYALEEISGVVPRSRLLPGQLPLGAQAVQIGQQLLHAPQVLHGLVIRLVPVHALVHQVLPAAVQVLAELLNELHLGGGIGGGGQTAGHRDDKSRSHIFHGIIPPQKKSRRPAGRGSLPTPACFPPDGGAPRR